MRETSNAAKVRLLMCRLGERSGPGPCGEVAEP